MYLLNNLKIDIAAQRVVGDTQYPAGWFLDAASRVKVGVTEVADIAKPNFDLNYTIENPNGTWTLIPKSLAEVKANTLGKITQARDAACTGNCTAHTRQWQADARSQALLSAAITMAMAGAPLPAAWRDVANNNMNITLLSELVAIAGAIAAQTQAAFVKSWALKAQVAAATTPEAAVAVVW